MIKDLFFVWWFFAPAGVANIAAFFSGKIPGISKYSYPVDMGKSFRGKRILGNNKTYRGFVAGIIGAIIIVLLQVILYNQSVLLRNSLILNYNHVNILLLGGLLGFGALLGDSVKSFFKRQFSVSPGKSWFPFDQIDYILGGILTSSVYVRLSMGEYIVLFWIWFLLHPLTTLIGYLFKLKDSPL